MPEIGQTISHFKLVEKIGVGGMGTVFLAEDLTLDRKVALKFLPDAFTSDPERMARFEREAKLLASLNHPNIAGIHGLEQADGNRFLVLEYIEGETLQTRLSKGALPLEEALELCRQIAEGLEAAHEKGVIHRDLKPANVMITAEEKVKILDFGLAKAFSDETQSIDSSQSPTLTETMTRPGMILGTAAYMSPEQAKGKSVDKRADIWAFGCILYECLTGKRAFEGETVTETLAAVIRGEPDWNALPTTTPQNIQFVLRRCLEKDKGRRFRDAADVQIEIEETRTLSKATVLAKKPRLKLAWSIAALSFLVALILAFVHFRQKAPSAAESMKLQIEVPEEVNLAAGSLLALSPDGRILAFASSDADGYSHLWLRRLDSFKAQLLEETKSSSIPPFFWSPDSRFIAFQAGGKLKKVDISNGSIQPICDLSGSAVGGSWNLYGNIIFSDYSASDVIMQVSAAGGNPSPLTRLDPTRKETTHVFPKFLPDGRHFIYFCDSSVPEYSGVYVGSLDVEPEKQERTQILVTTSAATNVPPIGSIPDQLLFMRDQTLWAQSFDEKRLERIGEPVPILEKVGSYHEGFFSASETGILVFKSDIKSELWQPTWFDRQGNPLGVIGEPGIYYRMAISPDETKAVISRRMPPTMLPSDVWILDFLQDRKQRVTYGPGDSSRPIWSADGDKIIFMSNRDGVYNLYEKAVNGVEPEQLIFKSPDDKIPTSYSRKGHFILYTAVRSNSNNDLCMLSLERNEEIPIASSKFKESDGHFSPNMRWIAYVSDESGSNEIHIRTFSPDSYDASSSSESAWTVSKDGGMGPRWRENSKELFYRTLDGKVVAVEITDETINPIGKAAILFQGDPDGTTLGTPVSFSAWDVSKDGSKFLLLKQTVEGYISPFNVILNWERSLEK